MEGLVLLLGEFLVLPFLLGFTLLVDLFVLAVDLLLHLVVWAVSSKLPRTSSSQSAQVAKRRVPYRTIGRWTAIMGAAVLALLLTAVAFVNWFFLDAIVRWQLGRVQANTGIAVTFDSANGSLWSGVIELHDVECKRLNHDISEFELSAETFVIDLSAIDLLFLDAVFERVEVQGLRGTYDRLQRAEKLNPRKAFEVDRLQISDALIKIKDQTRGQEVVEAELQIDSLLVEPLRSDWAVFDALFRSNTKGRINGQDFAISTGEIRGGRQTRWQGDGLPVELMRSYLGGPLDWVTAAKVDIDVTDRWKLGDSTEIEMHWKVVLRDIEAEVPPDASKMTKVVAVPAVAFLNKHSLRLPLEFNVVIDRDRFHFSASPDAAELGRTVGEALADELGKQAGIEPDVIKNATAKGWNKFKDYLDKRRKENDD